jgi:hypothetical protein
MEIKRKEALGLRGKSTRKLKLPFGTDNDTTVCGIRLFSIMNTTSHLRFDMPSRRKMARYLVTNGFFSSLGDDKKEGYKIRDAFCEKDLGISTPRFPRVWLYLFGELMSRECTDLVKEFRETGALIYKIVQGKTVWKYAKWTEAWLKPGFRGMFNDPAVMRQIPEHLQREPHLPPIYRALSAQTLCGLTKEQKSVLCCMIMAGPEWRTGENQLGGVKNEYGMKQEETSAPGENFNNAYNFGLPQASDMVPVAPPTLDSVFGRNYPVEAGGAMPNPSAEAPSGIASSLETLASAASHLNQEAVPASNENVSTSSIQATGLVSTVATSKPTNPVYASTANTQGNSPAISAVQSAGVKANNLTSSLKQSAGVEQVTSSTISREQSTYIEEGGAPKASLGPVATPRATTPAETIASPGQALVDKVVAEGIRDMGEGANFMDTLDRVGVPEEPEREERPRRVIKNPPGSRRA